LNNVKFLIFSRCFDWHVLWSVFTCWIDHILNKNIMDISSDFLTYRSRGVNTWTWWGWSTSPVVFGSVGTLPMRCNLEGKADTFDSIHVGMWFFFGFLRLREEGGGWYFGMKEPLSSYDYKALWGHCESALFANFYYD
jgi:hypothetical protein